MNRPPYEREVWTAEDLQAFVDNQALEDQHLEFKSIDALHENKRVEMSCDVSAMANADGGTIIYGISEDKNHRAASLSGVEFRADDREMYNQVLNSRIQPCIDGLRLSQVDIPGTKTSALVIDVPRAVTLAPHQANDGRYYRRFAFQRLRLDHSGVVDLFRRAEAPDLQIRLRSRYMSDLSEEATIAIKDSPFSYGAAELFVENMSEMPCMYALIDIYVDERLAFWGVAEEWDQAEISAGQFVFKESVYKARFRSYQRKWNGNAPNMVPLFSGGGFFLGPRTCGIGFYPDHAWVPHFIKWRCRAPHMSSRQGSFALWLTKDGLHVEAFDWPIAHLEA